jgi:hypothetical protein
MSEPALLHALSVFPVVSRALFRLSFRDDAIEGESWVWNHWEPSATAHEVLYEKMYAKEIPETEALAIARELALRPDKPNER